MNETENILGRRIASILAERGLEQKDLSQLTNIHRKQISRYVTGDTVPSAIKAGEIARALNTTTDYLLGLTNDPRPTNLLDTDDKIKEIIKQTIQEYEQQKKDQAPSIK